MEPQVLLCFGSFHTIRCVELLLSRCAYGANTSAGTAADASVSVDYIGLLALGDSGNGALSLTCTALDAICRNYICHDERPPLLD